MPLHQGPHASQDDHDRRRLAVNPFHGATNPLGGMTEAPPTHRLPDTPLPPQTAYRLVHDELMLDGNARLTWPPSSPPGWSPRPGS